jgi:putative MATE family efflux protein
MTDSHHQRRPDLSADDASFGAAEDASPDTAEAAEDAEGASPDAADRHEPSLGSEILGVLRGRTRDYTRGSLWRAIIVLSVPMVLEMAMQSVFEVVDIYFVGRLGAEAVAAVGLTASLIIIVFAVGLGLSLAATAMVARRIGEKDERGAASAAWQCVVLTLAVAVPAGLVAVFISDDLLRLMGAAEAVVRTGTGYAQVMLGTNVVILLLFLFNAVFRGAGDAATAMKALWIANLFNIALDPLFIFGLGPVPAMGTTGAAIATAVGRAVGVGYQVHVLFRGSGRLRMTRQDMAFDESVARRLLRISGPGMLQYLVGTASWLALMRMMAVFGSEAVAGYTVAIRVIVFALLPSWGISNAASTLVGQNLGARRPERAERSVWYCTVVDMVFLTVLGAVFFVFAEPVVRLFVSEAGAVSVGVRSMKILTAAYPIWAVGMVTVQSFNGAGDTRTPTWIHFCAFWIIQLPVAWVLAVPGGMGPTGIFVAIVIGQTMAAAGAGWMFRRGGWKHVEV